MYDMAAIRAINVKLKRISRLSQCQITFYFVRKSHRAEITD